MPVQRPGRGAGAKTIEEEGLTNLAQVLAHRIRGLVTGIEGFVDLLIDTLGTREQRELALRIFESASRIERVLSDLQRYSKPVRPALRPVQVHVLLEEALLTLAEADQERIRLDVRTSGCNITADPMLLRQALLVLLQNALDATRHEGNVCLSAICHPADRVLRFEVQNDGTIDLPDAEVQVFTPFFTTKAHNLGVGLSIAQRIAEAHGGSLRLAANGDEQGTVFTLALPLESVAEEA